MPPERVRRVWVAELLPQRADRADLFADQLDRATFGHLIHDVPDDAPGHLRRDVDRHVDRKSR